MVRSGDLRCLTIRPWRFWGILFISEQVFRATGSDPAWFGAAHLSEFAPVMTPPFSGDSGPANPQAGAGYRIWLSLGVSRVSP